MMYVRMRRFTGNILGLEPFNHPLYNNRKSTFYLSPNSLLFFGVIDVTTFKSGRKQNGCNIGIKHGFPCINLCQVSREVLKTEAEGRGFQHLPRDLANVNVLENNV